MRVIPAALDFGLVEPLSRLDRIVSITNNRDETVSLCEPGADCVCLRSAVDNARLIPQQSAKWHIELETCDHLGEVRSVVWLTDQVTGGHAVRVPVRYMVVPELFIEPAHFALGVFDRSVNSPVESRIEVKTIGDEVFELVAVRCDDGRFEVMIEQSTVRRNRPGMVHVRLQAPVARGPVRPTVWVTTNSATVPELRLAVFGEATDGVASNVPELVFKPVVSREAGEASIELAHHAATRVGRVRVTDAVASVKRVDRSPERTEIVLSCRSDLPLGHFKGQVVVELAGSTSQKVRVPLRGQVVEPAATDRAVATLVEP